ncbi:hypothetical protein HBH70_009260 [Parastagonospora nodorum]|nr:hypothetical protein HBH52_036440 [Parastagonospora nodorum]KAH4073316.1 hypothetical protein HBH50_052460 [Parastagonospora nodorum]KAH4099626.1 hypothetical protein HBH48_009700 [Parastagonospora nodorum]KAH4127995.1 hypothetical protein HBH47_040030 [Parastagonospora nodorum]KAH4234748.1 hypothetical protein HBI06_057760 [Parastagonospora nodorum]
MPITFGAVGDIISVCLLVKDLVEALDKARGSKAEYQSAIRELWILDRALLEIDLLSRVHGGGATPALQGLCATAKQAVIRCKGLVSDFLHRVRRYQKVLGEGEKPNVLHETAMKLQRACTTLLDLSRKEINKRLEQANERHNLANSSHQALLCDIQGRIEDANRGIDTNNSILGKVTDALRLDWLRQLGSELKGLLHRSIAINLATYQAVISNQVSLPSRLERGLIEEPVILEDALGRIAPVHLQFVTSWDAFDAILEIRFRGFQGHKKIAQRQYGLQDRVTGREVEQSRAWQYAFLPGQRVEMSMVFHNDEPTGSRPGNMTCLGCHTPASSGGDTDIQCVRCSIWYRRVTIIEETGPCETMPRAQTQESDRAIGRNSKRLKSRKRKRALESSDSDSDEEDVREFKRVRIMSTLRRNRQDHPLDTTGQVCPTGSVPLLYATLWGDENTLCFQVTKKGHIVARRQDNNMINGTKLLNVARVPRPRRDEILNSERVRHVVALGPPQMNGVWIPYDRALQLANEEGITEDMYPLFVHDIGALSRDTSYDTAFSAAFRRKSVKRATDPGTLREPPVAGPFHTSWETALGERNVLSTAAQCEDAPHTPPKPTDSLMK